MDWICSHLNSIGVAIIAAGVLLLVLAQSQELSLLTASAGRALSDFSFLKLVYSLIILSLVTLLLTEVRRVWVEDKNRLGNFRYFEEGGEKSDRSVELVLRIADRHGELVRKFALVEQSELESEQRLVPTTREPIEGAKNILQDLDITLQEINVTDILSRLRRWISAPNEIVGAISKTGDTLRASIELPENGYELADESRIGRSMQFDGHNSVDDVAFEIACALIWLDAAQEQREIAVIGRQEFCDWTSHWSNYLNLSRRLARTGSLPAADVAQVRAAREALTKAIEGGASFPKFWSLRADFVELLPEEERDQLLIERQSDELEYLTRLQIDAKDRLTGDSTVQTARAYEVLASARPALLVEDGVVQRESQQRTINVDPLWDRLFELESSRLSVQRAAVASGLFTIVGEPSNGSDIPPMPGMGFAIGDGLIATAAYSILEPLLQATEADQVVEIPEEWEADFVFADRWPDGSDETIKRHRILRIFYVGAPSSVQLALLEIDGHDTELIPPLEIDLDAIQTLSPRGFVCLVGFPESDSRLPSEFMDALLGAEGGGHKRVMPGRVVRLPSANAAPRVSLIEGNAIIVDASTSGGTGGAPLIDLVSGRLTGVNFAGRWQSLEDGKFAYSAPIPWLFPSERMRTFIRQQGANITLGGLVEQIDAAPVRSSGEVLAGLVAPEDSKPPDPTDPTLTAQGYNADFLSTSIPLPSIAGSSTVQISNELEYPNFSVVMNTAPDRRMALIAAENVNGSQLYSGTPRADYRLDPRLEVTEQPDNALFRQNVLDRGGLARRTNVSWGNDRRDAERAAEATFYYTNVTPQLSELNRRSWLQLEEELLTYVEERGLMASFFSGPVFADDDPEYRGIRIPQAYWKIMVADVDGEVQAIGYLLEQEITITDGELSGRAAAFDAINSKVDITRIALMTGIDFGPIEDLPVLDFG